MQGSPVRRAAALLGTAALLASMAATVATPAAALDCTYQFPAGGGSYTAPVTDGQTICGGPGNDQVTTMKGGLFLGGGGDDFVLHQYAGTFRGETGKDGIDTLYGGIFVGGPGGDWVNVMWSGVVRGGGAADRVITMRNGIFNGGPGDDYLDTQLDGVFRGNLGDDAVAGMYGRGRFRGGPGNDSVGQTGAQDVVFLGGYGRDRVDVLSLGRFVGGPGWDEVGSQDGGIFKGNKGNDSINRDMTPYDGLSAGMFDGGGGKDMAALCLSGVGSLVSVEVTNDIECTVNLL